VKGRTDEGAKRPVTRRARQLAVRGAVFRDITLRWLLWVELKGTRWSNYPQRCEEKPHRVHCTTSRRERRVTGRFAPS